MACRLCPPPACPHRLIQRIALTPAQHRLSCQALLLAAADAFYLPGVAPKEYADGDKVDIKVHKLSSPKTHLPYDYYSLPFCKPEEVSERRARSKRRERRRRCAAPVHLRL